MRYLRLLKRPLFWVIVVLFSVATKVTLSLMAPPPPPAYLTDTVRQEKLVRSVLATGQLYASEMVQVGAQASGQIKSIQVKLGQTVKKGQIIAVIDSEQQENALQINQARLKSARAQLTAAQTHLKLVQEQYDRLARLIKQGAISQQQLDTERDAKAQAELSVAQTQAQIAQLELSIQQNKTELSRTLITSPMDGVVVAIWVDAGQTVSAYNQIPTIAQVANLSTMLNRFRINEADINEVKAGQAIQVSTLSPDIPMVTSTVTSVDPGLTNLTQGRFTNNVETVNQAIYYYGRALVPNTDHRYRIGMTTQNRIIIAQGEGLTVPNQAIRYTKNGKSYVNVLVDVHQPPKKVAVKLGLSDGIRTIVTDSTLKAGEYVITGLASDYPSTP